MKASKAVALAHELTRTATNTEFEDLREDMVEEILLRRAGSEPADEVLVMTVQMLCTTMSVLADDIARTADLRAILEELTNRPNFNEMLDHVRAWESARGGPAVVVDAGRISVVGATNMTFEKARQLAVSVLEASTANLAGSRTLRRPVGVDEALRERDT